MHISIFYQAPPIISLIHKLKKLFLFLSCFIFPLSYSNAEIIYSLPSNSTRIEFSTKHYPSGGPITENGITWTSTYNTSAYGYDGLYGLGPNGTWDSPLRFIGLNIGSGTMTIEFARLASSVFGFINYAPSAGFGKIAIYDSSNTLIESLNLSISTPGGNNAGESIGFKSSNTNIKYFTLSDAFIVLADLYALYGPSSADTQSSLTTLSKSLRSSFNATLMSSNYVNMNTYDCNLFDKNNMCISAGGRITTIDNPSSHHSAAVVVLGYKVSPHIRIGGFLDQSVNHNMPSGVDMSNKNPMMGAFLVWNHQADGLGLQMKLANAYLDKDVTTSRAVIGTSEAGRGRTDLNTQSYVGELSYAFNYQEQTIVRSYFALRHTRIKQDGYTEETTASVTSPLTYAKLSDRSTTALMGLKVNHALTPKTNLTASLGIEQDLDHKSDQLVATGVSGLTSENFYNNIRHTRPVASLGAYYAVAKNQRLSGDIYYQQLPFQSTDSATAYVNYMIGF